MDISQECLFSLHAVFGFLMNLISKFKNACLSRQMKKCNLNNATGLICIDFKTFHMHENIISLSTAPVVIIRMVLGFWVVLKLKKKNPLLSSANDHWLSCREERSACVCLRLML